jgi:TolB-like protein
MKSIAFIPLFLCLVLCGQSYAQDIDTELSKLSETLAGKVSDQGKKKVAIIDFTDLQGASSELGKYIAEQLTVDLVMNKKNFAVLDRANLKSILAEHKLTATGLVDPDNAKKLGQFAGVDAIILGTIIPKGSNVNLTAKIITTDTAEIVGAAKAVFKADDTVAQFAAKPATDSSGGGAGTAEEKPSVIKSLRELRVEMQPLQIVNDKMLVLTMTITNQSPKKTVWVALSSSMMGTPKGSITDSTGTEFTSDAGGVSGIAATLYQQPANGFCQATEIRPGDAVTATIKFYSREGRTPATGQCNLSLEFLLGYDFNPGFGNCTAENFVTKIKTE